MGTKYCGDCGERIDCHKNGALMFSIDLSKYRITDAYLCKRCDKMILDGHRKEWEETPIEKIDLKPRYNISISYEHYSSVQDRPVCADCSKTMDFMGEGVLLDEDERAGRAGRMWVCPHCDFIFLETIGDWSQPLSIDEKRILELELSPNMIKMNYGVTTFFQRVKDEEEMEGKRV